MHHKARWPLTKRANKGFRGYPIATVAFYGPDDRRAAKVAVGIVPTETSEATELERWRLEAGDVRDDVGIMSAALQWIEQRAAKSVAVTDRIVGCPHEEGIDYRWGRAARNALSGRVEIAGPEKYSADCPGPRSVELSCISIVRNQSVLNVANS